jgi:hypothetical protein
MDMDLLLKRMKKADEKTGILLNEDKLRALKKKEDRKANKLTDKQKYLSYLASKRGFQW